MVRSSPNPEKDDKEKKVTFITKDPITCPCCEASFHREELFQGRVNAGELTDELHRRYIPMRAFGTVYPLVYDVTVCPSCWFAAFKYDFAAIPPKRALPLKDSAQERVEAAQRVFPDVDFNEPRALESGAASYYLAMMCYDRLTKEFVPTMKQGLCALRAAWLCGYLEAEKPGQNYGYASRIFYGKARILYRLAAELDQKGKEQLALVKWLGPDTDKNYGYEGVLYLSAVLELRYGSRADEAKRADTLDACKRTLAKMFGIGKKSRAKPGPLVDKVRDVYDQIKAELHQDDDEDED
jgi:uncharacterized protein (DUF2225 family)